MCLQSITAIIFVLTVFVTKENAAESIKAEQIKIFKKYILEELDMKEEPKTVAKNFALSRSLKRRKSEMPTNVAENEYDSYNANAILQSEKIGVNTYKFDFENLNIEGLQKIYAAKLTIFHDAKTLPYGSEIQVSNIKDTSKKEIASIPINIGGGEKNSIDITKHISDWVDTLKTKDIYRLKFECNNKKCLDSKMTPVIEIEYTTTYNRVKRKSRKCRKGNRCCLKHISVTVKELGWHNWFIAPQVFNLYYCTGSCKNQEKSFYGKLVELATGKKTDACCMPTRLKDFNMMHLTDNHTAYVKRLKNMMVTDCECT